MTPDATPDSAPGRRILARLRLSGLDPAARYTDRETGLDHLGATLLNVGLDQPGSSDSGSALIRLRRH